MASTSISGRVASEQGTICVRAELAHSAHSRLHSGCKHISRRARYASMICASSAAPYGSGGGSEIVDSNMSVLRKRIHRLRTLEAMEGPPEDWMEWEKSCYSSYRADVAYLMADLQSHLLGIRPSVSLFLFSVLLSAMPVACLLLLRVLLQYWIAHS